MSFFNKIKARIKSNPAFSYFVGVTLLSFVFFGGIVLFLQSVEEKGANFSLESKTYIYCDDEGYAWAGRPSLFPVITGDSRKLYYMDDTPVMCTKESR